MEEKQRLAIAIDVGATRIKGALFSQEKGVLVSVENPTLRERGVHTVIKQIVRTIESTLGESDLGIDDVEGVGVAFAAYITDEGVVGSATHIGKDWTCYPLGDSLREQVSTNFYFALDIHAAVLGEGYYGAGKGIRDFICITVGTGIGAGIIVDGKLFLGGLGTAGTVGHMIVAPESARRCTGCGQFGCLETVCATQGFVESAKEAIESGVKTKLLELSGGSVDKISPQLIYEAAKVGDEVAIDIFNKAGYYFGIGLVNIIQVLAPQRIIVGGGISKAGDLFLEPARNVVREMATPDMNRMVDIVPSNLGDMSGAYGAAAMVFHNIRITNKVIL